MATKMDYKSKYNIVPSPSAKALRKSLSTMSSHQLGPENPRPFSVLTEHHVRQRVTLPYVPQHEKYMFGPQYENKMCELINQYLELNTYDQLCYVGDPKGSFADVLQDSFCLLKPVVTVMPGHIHYEESPNHKMLPFKVANVGAEEFFKCEAAKSTQFDKVLLNDTIQFIDDQPETYKNILKTLHECGKLLIIHRAAPMCTLPLFSDLKERMLQYDNSYLSIIQDLQSCGLEVQWEIESLPIHMPKLKWMSMLKDRFPSQLELVSDHEILSGMRELSEGVMKYPEDIVEFPDRLMFITAQRPVFNFGPKPPPVLRYSSCVPNYRPGGVGKEKLYYEMEVTSDIQKIVTDKERREQMAAKRKNNRMDIR